MLKVKKFMRILSIETSCDDTGIAILDKKGKNFKVLANELSSQIELHKKYGGVYPSLAKREHTKNLPVVLAHALAKAKINDSSIDAIALTVGPGLDPCLWTGITFAKELAKKWGIPIIPVNHIEGHLLISLLSSKNTTYKIPDTKYFPAIALIVSGGHTQLILVEKIRSYSIIGETCDDAAGEALDKTARILGLPYPGGPAIAAAAEKLKTINYKLKTNLPRPMINSKNYDFSFSGLKTAVLYKVQAEKNRTMDSSMVLSENFVSQMCIEIQQAIIDVLLKKTIKAAKDYKVKTIILGGGVSANQELRKQLAQKVKKEIINYNLLVPEPTLSTDNALMIAITGYFHKNKKASWKKLKANANLRIE